MQMCRKKNITRKHSWYWAAAPRIKCGDRNKEKGSSRIFRWRQNWKDGGDEGQIMAGMLDIHSQKSKKK